MSARILVVEDDRKTADTVALYLRHEGFEVTLTANGSEGARLGAELPFDLCVLDRMLPGADGLTICRAIRERSSVPVIMLTAMVSEEERLQGFAAGVDDYVTKPFSPRELMARVRAVLRRTHLQREARVGIVRVGGLILDHERREARLHDRTLDMSPTEFRLLYVLAKSAGRVFTRDELAERALPEGSEATARTIDAHVKNLRRKLDGEDASERASHIDTVFGVGYRLNAEACKASA